MLPKSQVIALLLMSGHCISEVSETFTIAELSEHHHQQLVPTSEMLDILIALIFTNEVVKMVTVKCNRYELREHIRCFQSQPPAKIVLNLIR